MSLRDDDGNTWAAAFGPVRQRARGHRPCRSEAELQRRAAPGGGVAIQLLSSGITGRAITLEINLPQKILPKFAYFSSTSSRRDKGKAKALFSRVKNDLQAVTARGRGPARPAGCTIPAERQQPLQSLRGSRAKKCTSAPKCMINSLNHSSVTELSHDLSGEGASCPPPCR